MNNQETHLIEHILTLSDFLQKHNLDFDWQDDPNASAAQISLDDTPELKMAYESIRFMDEMPGGFMIYYADGGEEIIYVNKALLRIFQCNTMKEFREWTNNSFRGFVHPDDLDEVEESIEQQITGSQYDLDYVEYRITRKDGAIRWIEDYGHFIQNKWARDVFYVFVGDATEKRERHMKEKELLVSQRRRNEQKLRSQIEEYDKERALINQEYLRRLEIIEGLSISYESIFYVDLDEDIIRPYRLGGRTGAMFDGKEETRRFSRYVSDYVDKWVDTQDRELVSEFLNSDNIRKTLSDTTTYYINYHAIADGETSCMQLRYVNVGVRNSRAQIVLGFQRVDEEIQREMEQRQILTEALDDAKQAILAKNAFLSNMSHDMRTPLNAIFGFLSLAKTSTQDRSLLLEYIESAENSSKRLLDQIDEILEYSWAESHEADLEKMDETECDLCQIVRGAYDFLRPQAEGKGLELTLDIQNIVHSTVYSDPHKLKQIMIYLCDNAVTYTNLGGRVSVTVTERQGRSDEHAVYQLEVADTGIGISKEFLEHIYEPFAREKDTTHSGIHGVGLGLTITKSIVERMGGIIDVKSTLGEGSVFTVTMQLRIQHRERKPSQSEGVAPSQAVTAAPAGSGKSSSLEGRSVLLVEDNEINLIIETKIFRELGFHIKTAKDGDIAVDMVKNSKPGDYDLVLMDIQMPVMDGWKATREIRSLKDPALATIPIVALSANVLESDIQKSMACGMDAHLPKPVNVPELVKTVEEVLQKKSHRS